jgi:hypothetical protein
MTDAELSRALGRLEGRLDAFEGTRIERPAVLAEVAVPTAHPYC